MYMCNNFPFRKKFHQAVSVLNQNTACASDGNSAESGESGPSNKWALNMSMDRNPVNISRPVLQSE